MTPGERLDARAPDALSRAADALASGAIVGVPTETVYGLACLPVEAALRALLAAKARSTEKGIALLVDSLSQVKDLAVVPDAAHRLAERFWPGPLTLVLPARTDAALPELLTGGRSTLGFRLPDHDVPRALARRLGPLALTSANISGQPDATTADELLAGLGSSVALVLDDGPVRGGVPSTVVAIDAQGSLRVLRHGALAEEALTAALG